MCANKGEKKNKAAEKKQSNRPVARSGPDLGRLGGRHVRPSGRSGPGPRPGIVQRGTASRPVLPGARPGVRGERLRRTVAYGSREGSQGYREGRWLTLKSWMLAVEAEVAGSGGERARGPADGGGEDVDGGVDPRRPGSIPLARTERTARRSCGWSSFGLGKLQTAAMWRLRRARARPCGGERRRARERRRIGEAGSGAGGRRVLVLLAG